MDDLFSDSSYYDANPDVTYLPSYRDIERINIVDQDLEETGGWGDFEGTTVRSMARTARQKILIEIDRQLRLPAYDSYNIDPADIRVGLQIIDRIEFYNPDVLVAAAVFKTTNQPLDKQGISSFQRPRTVSDFNLYRYYRFLTKIKFAPRHS